MENTGSKPKLQHFAEFNHYLNEETGAYRPSDESIDILRSLPHFVLLTGTTGSGRSTLIDSLLETGDYYFPISTTTRPPRENNGRMEVNGREYWFDTAEGFLEGLKAGKFIEAAIIHNRQVSGIGIEEIQKAKDLGKTAIRDVEIQGIVKLHEYKPDAVCLFVLPPAFLAWMDRIQGRGSMPEDELIDRLASSYKEISTALKLEFIQFIVSGDLDANIQMVQDYAYGRISELPDQDKAQTHAHQLLIDIRERLDQAA